MKKVEPIVAHGLTARMFEEIKLRKIAGDVERIPANLADKLQDKFFKEDFKDYEINMFDRRHYHVAMEVRNFDASTGSRLSVPMVQMFDEVSWKAMKASDHFKTFKSEFVHNPELEPKDAPLVTLKYTLTEEEAAALKGEDEEQEEDETIDPKILTLEQVEAITDVKVAKTHVKALGGKPTKSMTLEAAKAVIIDILQLK